ncbi:hypothetical protein [Pseudomonas putida]|uniref:hypothetical protein n=1 Tax=Pseudomonas putida TaxID=303 RepID=UPI0012DAA922|nr:hypothetical protein [Pseudomonas putida]
MAPATGVAGVVSGAAISGGANIGYQLSTDKPFSYVDASIAATVGGATQGRGLGFTLGAGAGGSYLGSLIKGEDPTYSLLGAILGGVVGFRTGQVVSGQLKPYVGTSADVLGNMFGSVASEVTGGKVGSLGEGK